MELITYSQFNLKRFDSTIEEKEKARNMVTYYK